jgi:hypothetical protein
LLSLHNKLSLKEFHLRWVLRPLSVNQTNQRIIFEASSDGTDGAQASRL